MNKAELIKQLELFQAWDETEENNRLMTLAFLNNSHEDWFDSHNINGHITATSFILSPDGSQTLLLHHNKLDKWFAPGGHCEGHDKSVMEACRREGEEETGLGHLELALDSIFDIDVHTIPEYPKRNMPAHTHFSVTYLFRATDTNFTMDANEAFEMKWLTPDQVLEKQNQPDYQRMVAKWQLFVGK